PFRVHHHVGPALAQAQRAAGGDLDGVRESLGGDLPAQHFDHVARSARRAAGDAFGLLLVANVNVVSEWLHGDNSSEDAQPLLPLGAPERLTSEEPSAERSSVD